MIKQIALTLAVGLASLEGAAAAAAQPAPTAVVASHEGRALDVSELALPPNPIVAESALGSTATATADSLAAQEPSSDIDEWQVTFTQPRRRLKAGFKGLDHGANFRMDSDPVLSGISLKKPPLIARF